MTVKIDKYKITRCNKEYMIINRVINRIIIKFMTPDEQTNKTLAELVLKELNTGKFENYISKRSDDD